MKSEFPYPLSFDRLDDGRVLLAKEVVIRFLDFRQLERTAPEAGGVLMGRFIQDSGHIAIDLISEPMIEDVRRRTFFFRAEKRHQEIVNRVWTESESTCTYLGEWHTHPEDDPTPSSVDLNEWNKKLKQNPNHRNALMFIIVGRERFRIWEGSVIGKRRAIKEIFPTTIH